MNRRYKPLNEQLTRVLEKVSANIREQHHRASNIGKVGRSNRYKLLQGPTINPIFLDILSYAETDEDENLDNPGKGG